MHLVDANVLLYSINRASPHHKRALSWLDNALNSDEPVGFTWVALLAFLRLATHPSVFARPLTTEQAVDVVHTWLALPSAVIVEPGPRHASILGDLLVEAGSAGNLVNDAHLAALAMEHGAVISTFDADFGRFRGVRWGRPGG